MPTSNHPLTRAGLALLLWLVALPAFALGLGQIVVRSGPGQPLQAEIPILAEPSELAQLQARLASPDTFARVGLPAPDASLNDLQFTVASDARGRPVIRVSSMAPVTQPVLNFLIEVDWGQGRLVREYSALLTPPSTLAAAPDVVQAPQTSDNLIQPAPAEAPVAASPAAAAAPEPAPEPPAPEQAGTPPAPEPEPLPAPSPESNARPIAPPPAPAASDTAPGPSSAPADRLRVVRGDTLGQLATGLGGDHDQTMIALLRANPEAFIGDNINRLRSGAVLRVPSAEEIAAIDQRAARALVGEQVAAWRNAQRALPQPAVAAASAAAERSAATPTSPTASATQARSGARLEIVPPADGRAQDSATRSGIAAGGKGDAMLQQQLQETKETLAARDQEVRELQSRVADLEKLRGQQQQLIALKDSALADAQKNLATQNAATPPQAYAVPAWQWVAGVAGAVLVAGLLGWVLGRRRDREIAPRLKQRLDRADLAAAMPTTLADAAVPASTPSPVAPSTPAATPTWHAPSSGVPIAADVALAQQRLEAAQVLLDQGDVAAARVLLHEVLAGRDPAAGEQAARMLRDLG